MLVGLISDTHDNVDRIEQAVSVFNERGVVLIVHAGDFTSPFSLKPFEKLRADFVGIYGNNDGDRLLLRDRSKGRIHCQPHKFTFSEKRIVVMHEPDLVDDLASSGHFDLIVYGHTHRAEIGKINNTLMVNPGEAGHWLYGKATVAVVDIKKMEGEIISL
ncbi:MAG TPA: metallophosphoesterase [Nitrospirae bacterium]|jgi:putative phosphoesterase|nr:metallophosphoesterase [Nitrospirota bacterium]